MGTGAAGPCPSPLGGNPLLKLIAVQKLDDFAIRSGDESNVHLGWGLAGKVCHTWRNARDGTGRNGTRIGRVHVGYPQAEMQQCAFGCFLVRLTSPSLRLDGGPWAEHFDESAIACVKKRRSIDPPRHRELITHTALQALGVKLDGRIEIRGADATWWKPWPLI